MTRGERPPVLAPTRSDPLARALSAVVGGPVGRHGRPHPWWTPVRVLLLLTTGLMALALVHHVPCVATSWASDATRYGKMCYSDVPYLYSGRGLAEGLWPYADHGGRYSAMEYPVVIAYVAWALARVVQLFPSGPALSARAEVDPGAVWGLPGMVQETNAYFWVTALVMAAAALAATWFLATTRARRPWDALPFALSPCLLVTAFVNWDLLAVALVAAALWAWSRDRPLLTGVLIGLGTATKLYPLFLLGGVLVICWRRRRFADLGLATLGAVVAWVVADLPALVTGRAQWEVFWTFNSERGADLGSLWLVLSHLGVQVDAHGINLWSWAFFGTVCALVALLGVGVRRTPDLAQLGFLVVAGFLLVNKVYSPQYVLWLLPLAVLARPRWRDLLVWQAGELVYFAAVWLYLGGWLEAGAGGESPAYDLAILVRVAAELYLVAVVVRDVVRGRPLEEPVDSVDDDVVEGGGGEAHPHVDLVADGRHR